MSQHIFNKLGNYRCIKKLNYQLANAFKFEKEFNDSVIFASGINDLALYGQGAFTYEVSKKWGRGFLNADATVNFACKMPHFADRGGGGSKMAKILLKSYVNAP